MGVASGVSNLGLVKLDRGDPNRAGVLFEEGLALHRDLGDKDGVAHCLEGLAAVAALKGYHLEAAQLCGFVETLRKAIGAPLSPLEAAGHARRMAPARAALGAAAFAEAAAEGRATPLDEALILALATAEGSSRTVPKRDA